MCSKVDLGNEIAYYTYIPSVFQLGVDVGYYALLLGALSMLFGVILAAPMPTLAKCLAALADSVGLLLLTSYGVVSLADGVPVNHIVIMNACIVSCGGASGITSMVAFRAWSDR